DLQQPAQPDESAGERRFFAPWHWNVAGSRRIAEPSRPEPEPWLAAATVAEPTLRPSGDDQRLQSGWESGHGGQSGSHQRAGNECADAATGVAECDDSVQHIEPDCAVASDDGEYYLERKLQRRAGSVAVFDGADHPLHELRSRRPARRVQRRADEPRKLRWPRRARRQFARELF